LTLGTLRLSGCIIGLVGSHDMVELQLAVVRDDDGRLTGWLRRGPESPRLFSGTLDLLAGIDEFVPPPLSVDQPRHQSGGDKK